MDIPSFFERCRLRMKLPKGFLLPLGMFAGEKYILGHSYAIIRPAVKWSTLVARTKSFSV